MIRVVFLSFLLITGCASTEPVKDASEVDGTYFDSLFDSEFFAANADPFQEMHRIITEQSSASEQPAKFKNRFDVWYWNRYGRFPAEQIYYEDEETTFLIRLAVEVDENPTVNLRIEDDVLLVTGQLVRKTRWSERRKRLDQRIPVPTGLDRTSMFSWKNGEAFNIRIEKT